MTLTIYKGTSQSDARYYVLYLTKEGKEIVPKIIEKEKELDKELAQFLEKNIGFKEKLCVSDFKIYWKTKMYVFYISKNPN